MTEEKWLNSDRVLTPMMDWLHRRGTNRQFYLLAVARVRQVEGKFLLTFSEALLPLVEKYADGLIATGQIAHAARIAEEEVFERSVVHARSEADRGDFAADRAAVGAATPPDGWIAAINAMKDAERTGQRSEIGPAQVAILRDIFGNPFRPVAFDPSWRTSSAVGIAQSMYESRDFAAMPILADALEDAGCDSPDVLAHCRGDGPHVRGCWVIDHVLGKV